MEQIFNSLYPVTHSLNLAEEDPKDVWRLKNWKCEEIGKSTARVNGMASAF